MYLITPKQHVDISRPPFVGLPLFFLAGPINGGGDWQIKMCNKIVKKIDNCIIACPSRIKVPGCGVEQNGEMFQTALEWERYYLELAGAGNSPGCIIFWLPCENAKNPNTGPDPYAMNTRRELGEWMYRSGAENAKVAIGCEFGFPGQSVIERTYKHQAADGGTVFHSMGPTIFEAVRMAG